MKAENVDTWLGKLADRTPTPGGGGAAALLAATGAALVGMVSGYTTGKRWADREAVMTEINTRAAELRVDALALADEDAAAFEQVGAAYGLPRATDDEKRARTAAVQAALQAAAEPPRRTGLLAAEIVELAGRLVGDGNPNVVSDVAVAAYSASAALQSAIVNIEINAASITDEAVRSELAAAVATYEQSIEVAASIGERVREGLRR